MPHKPCFQSETITGITREDSAIQNIENATILPVSEKKALKKQTEKPDPLYTVHIVRAGILHNVDPALIKAVIMAESSFNPKAVSIKGAKGLMQLMPRTAEELGVKDCFNPRDNIHGGVAYLKKLLNRFDGDVELALAAYHAGSRKVRYYNGVPPFKSTRYYINKVLAYYAQYKGEPEKGLKRT